MEQTTPAERPDSAQTARKKVSKVRAKKPHLTKQKSTPDTKLEASLDAAQERAQEPDLAPDEVRVMHSLYLGSTLLKKLRAIAKSTDRSVQSVMREGLRMVAAKFAKGSAGE